MIEMLEMIAATNAKMIESLEKTCRLTGNSL